MSKPGAASIQEVKVSNPDELMRQYKKTGDPAIRNQLVMHYIQHVNVAIYSMRSILLSGVPFDDFFDQGVLALMDCIERYDPDRGTATFETYCYTGIRGAILKYMRKQNWLPNRLWEARKQISRAQIYLEQKLMRRPTDAELAEHLGISEKKLQQYAAEIAVTDTLSFEDALEQTYETILSRSFSAQEQDVGHEMMVEELRQALAKAIDALPPKQKQIISLYYYEELNLREIGEVLELSPQRISQLRHKALEQLHAALKDFDLT